VKVPREVIEAIRGSRALVVASHVPMDGDGLGCGLALARGLDREGRRCTVVTETPLPRAYQFLKGFQEVIDISRAALPPCDLLVGVDAGSLDRLGRAAAIRKAGTRVLNIDHHVSNAGYGDLNWIEPEAAATGEMVYTLLTELAVPIDPGMAQALLVSLITDTGRFCYSNTTPRTLEIAAALLRLGADPDAVNMALFRSVPLAVLKLRTRATEALRLSKDGRVAVITTPAAFAADLGVEEEDVKDLVDIAIAVEGVVVAALVRALPGGGTKVSLRSNDDRADVAAFAAAHGGGGHKRAAGFRSNESPERVERSLAPGLEALAVAAAE